MSLISPVSGQKWPWKTLVTILIAAWLNCAVLVMTGCATHGPSVSPDRPKATVPTWPKDLPTCLTTEKQLSAQFLQSDEPLTCSTPEPSPN